MVESRMKPFLILCLCLLISLAQARKYIGEEKDTGEHHNVPEMRSKQKLTEKASIPVLKPPYVGERCCNLSTTPTCSKKLGGRCIPLNETCIGEQYFGPKYCDFNKLKSCKCCVPTECKTLDPCASLNGTCVGVYEECNHNENSVSGEGFCSPNRPCKCCFPITNDNEDCPCGQNYEGGCFGYGETGNERKYFGHCMKTCDEGSIPLNRHTCNQTGPEDCNCCYSNSISCPKGCFNVGSECFMNIRKNTEYWKNAEEVCLSHELSLAEPQDPQALSEYLDNNFGEGSYWVGAQGTLNDNAAWLSGGVIGPAAPWFANWYNTCDDPNWCMYLLANTGCYNNNQCLGCWVCQPGDGSDYTKRRPLCECEPIYE